MKNPVISINNLDEFILHVLHQSNEYLEAHPALSVPIQKSVCVYRALTDLIPITGDKVFSGHLFPQVEAESELENSIALCKLGFYKHAISALRNLLELGLLSVYWDIEGQSHIEIQEWLKSLEHTPFRKRVLKKLKTHPNIQRFDDKHKVFEKTSTLFKQLSNFTHTKGMHYSNRQLRNSNVNTFNEQSLRIWVQFLNEVVKIVATFHILIYPVGLLYTPLDEKFGLNGPAGGFLRPDQMESIRKFLQGSGIDTLQEISDTCPEAKSLAAWVNERPDITEEELSVQAEQFRNSMKIWEDKAKPKE